MTARFGPNLHGSPPHIAIADSDLFLEHVAPPEHPERQERLLAVREGLALATAKSDAHSPLLLPIEFGDAETEQLVRVHDAAYIDQLGHLAGRSGLLDADTYLSPGSVGAAWRAAGAGVGLVQALHDGRARYGFALPRPPGHHALADRAMGFCLLNNVAVAAAHARSLGHERVLVLDWDVHHGNGTEAMFYDDPQVLFVSLHQFPNYPGTGAAHETGRGDGRGRTVNLPLPPGATDAVYAAAFERIVLPIIEQFSPSLVLVSSGFDAHVRDPLAQMRLTSECYGDMTRALLSVLPEACPVGFVLEGGYDLEALRDSSASIVHALSKPAAPPPKPSQPLVADQEAALRLIARAQAPFWRLS